MPKTPIKRNTAPRTRKGSLQRQDTKATGRKVGNGKKAASTRVIASSIFALTLKQIPSIAVKEPRKRYSSDDDFEMMYADILPIIQKAIKNVTGNESTFNPLLNGFDLSASFNFMLNMFKKEVLPKDWQFNIEKNAHDDHYHIVVYKACEFQSFWHAFDIGITVLSLVKKNFRLHNMFVRFIKNFCHYTNISPWYHGGLGYVDYQFKEFINDWMERHESDNEEEEYELRYNMEKVVESYNKGIVQEYETMIKMQPIFPIETLREQLASFRSNALVRWMRQACELMDWPVDVVSFCYPEMSQYEEGLMFDKQVSLLWNCDDPLTAEQEEYLEAESQGIGVMEPVLHIRLTTETDSLDFNELNKQCMYPKKLTELFHSFNETKKKYERKN